MSIVRAVENSVEAETKHNNLLHLEDRLIQLNGMIMQKIDLYENEELSAEEKDKDNKRAMLSAAHYEKGEELVLEIKKWLDYLEQIVKKNDHFVEEGEGEILLLDREEEIDAFMKNADKHVDVVSDFLGGIDVESRVNIEEEEFDEDEALEFEDHLRELEEHGLVEDMDAEEEPKKNAKGGKNKTKDSKKNKK